MEADIILRLAQLLNLPTPPNYNQQSVYEILTKTAEYIESTQPSGRNGNNRKKGDLQVVQKAKTLESELKVSITSVEVSENIKSKTEKVSALFKKERDKNGVLEEFILSQNQKISLLVEHVEKLVQFLKVESHLKAQAVNKSKEVLKEYSALESKCEIQVKKINAQNRFLYCIISINDPILVGLCCFSLFYKSNCGIERRIKDLRRPTEIDGREILRIAVQDGCFSFNVHEGDE